MSDDEEEEFVYDQDDEEQDEQNEQEVEAQNTYFGAKRHLSDGAFASAQASFESLLSLEKAHPELHEWGFKAVKRLAKMHIAQGNFAAGLANFSCVPPRQPPPSPSAPPPCPAPHSSYPLPPSPRTRALPATHPPLPPARPGSLVLERISSNTVTRNYAEKSINSILNRVSRGAVAPGAVDASGHLAAFFDLALKSLAAASGGGGSSLAFSTRLRLARIHLSTGNWEPLRAVLAELLAACEGGAEQGGSQEQVTSLMEVYSIQMQMYSAQGEHKRLGELVERARGKLRAAVSTPSVNGVINECLGKVRMAGRRWDDARVAFATAFQSFEEAGARERTLANLNYYLLANMLSSSRINPFDEKTAKSYERSPAVEAMVRLTELYMAGDHLPFTARVRAYAGAAGSDAFIRGYLEELLLAIRSTAALKVVSSYSRVPVAFVAAQLGMEVGAAQGVLVGLLMDGRLPADAAIDACTGVLTLRGSACGAPGERLVVGGVVGGAGGAGGEGGAGPASAVSAVRSAGKNVSGGSAGGYGARYAALLALGARLKSFNEEVEGAIARVGQRGGGPGGPGGGGGFDEDFGGRRRESPMGHRDARSSHAMGAGRMRSVGGMGGRG